jgi:hypothetical protein
MSKWEQIKEIKGLLAGLVTAFTVVSVIGLALMDWRVQVHVRNELAKQDLATDSNIMALGAGVADNKRTGEENAEDIDQNRQRVEAAFQALIGRPTNDDN